MATRRGRTKAGVLPTKIYGARIRLQRRPDVLTRKVGFDLGLYDPVTQDVHILNPTGATVWDHITPNRTYADIGRALALSYGTDEEHAQAIAADAYHVVKRLQQAGLVVSPGSKAARAEPPMRRPRIYFPDREVTRITAEYQRPSFNTYTLAELQDRFKLDEYPAAVAFADVHY